MSVPAHALLHAGDRLARERLEAYRRYAEVVAQQESALEAGDMTSFERFADEAHRLQDDLAVSQGLRELVHDPEADAAWFVDAVTDLVRKTVARNQRIAARLAAMGEGTRAGHSASARRARPRRYTGEPKGATRVRHLDLRF